MITKSYKKVKDDVLRCYKELLKDAKNLDLPEDDTSLKILKEQAAKIKEDRFCLMVAGEAKSGKSTFINAYLGTEILPMDVRQCTSSVVEIGYGTKFTLNATYADGRTEELSGKNQITAFLAENAALDDEYRDIPVTTIDNELIIKYKAKKIPKKILEDFLKGVARDNIHNLSPDTYNKKIKEYIKKKQPYWGKIVVKIIIKYPFKDSSLRGIKIIDSPGVNAVGRVGNATEEYIESADAIMFLRPITGQAIEANSFKEFLESKSVDRNKNAMFLLLTRKAGESEDTIQRAYEEFINIFGIEKMDSRHGVVKEQIIPIDSKAELYHNLFQKMSSKEIAEEIQRMNKEKKLESFVKAAWFDSEGEKAKFLKELKKLSNFIEIEEALNRFGRKAQFLALSEFLARMSRTYSKAALNLREKIDNYKLKAEDPNKLAVKIQEMEAEIIDLENRMNEKCDEIAKKYAGSASNTGIITKRANEVMKEYRKRIDKISDNTDSSLDELEKLSFEQVDILHNFQQDLRKNVVAECDEALKVALSEKNTLKDDETLRPDIHKIREDMRAEATTIETYEKGITFTETHTRPIFSQDRYYDLVKKNILDKIDEIKLNAIGNLKNFLTNTIAEYTDELMKNSDAKKAELEKVKEDKINAEEIATMIASLETALASIEPKKTALEEIKGDVDIYVQ